MKKNCLFSIALAGFSAFMTFPALAQPVIYQEDFSSFTVGTLKGQNGWDSPSPKGSGDCCFVSGTRKQVVTANFTPSSALPFYCTPTKGVEFLISSPTQTQDGPGVYFPNVHNFANTTFYAACLVNFSAGATTRGEFLRIYDNSSSPLIVARICAVQSGAKITFGVGGTGNVINAFTDQNSPATTYNANQAHLVIVKYTSVAGNNNDLIELFVDPTDGVEANAVVKASVTTAGSLANDPTSIKGLHFWGNAPNISNLPTGVISCIRVATTWGHVIPVEMNNFEAIAKGTTNLLTWTTASEKNVSHFEVEKSADGANNWNKIGETKAAGNSVGNKTYTFSDENPLTVSYYRIKTRDIDGTNQVSKVVSVKQKTTKGSVKIFPQPAHDIATIQLDATTTGKATIELLDAAGRLVLTKNADITEGVNNITFSTQNLANGLYLIRINNGVTTTTEKFVKR